MQQKNEKEQPSDRFRQENETLLHAFAMHNIDGIALINEAGVIVEWNHVMEEVTGLSAHETLGAKVWDVQVLLVSGAQRTPDAAERYRGIFQDMLRTGVIPERIVSNVSRVHRSDGREVFAEQKLFIIKTGAANWLGAVVRDVTDRKKVDEQIRRQAAYAEALGALSQVLTRVSRDYQLVLDTVVQRCAELIGDGASIFLYSPEQEFLELAAVYNPDPNAVEIFRAEMQVRPIRADEGAYAKVINEQQAVLIESIPVELLIERAPSPERREYYRKLPIYSMMLTPLLAHGKVLGCIGLARHAPGKNYSSEDLTFLQDIADRSALAVLNAQIYTALEQELAERKLTEQALRVSEEKFSKSFHTTQVLMTVEDADNVIIDVNRAFLENFGLEREEVLGKTIPDLNILYNPDDLTLLRREYQQKGYLKDFEIRIRNKMGEPGFVLLSSDNFYVDNAVYTLTSGLEITTRKQAETKLRNSEAHYRRAIDAAGAVPYYLDTRTNTYTFMGEGILAITGYSASEVTPHLWETLEQERIPRGSLAHLSYEQASWIMNEEPSVLWKCDYRIRTRDGQTRWVADTSVKGYNESGEEAGMIGILQDITERKQYEQEIQQRLHELAAIHTVSQAAASALEFSPLFDLVSTELFNLFDIQEIYFALYDRETNEVRFPYYRHEDQRIETDPVPFGQGLSSRVIMTREPLLINQDYERRSAELGEVGFSQPRTSLAQISWLGVPIRAGEKVIGMICMMNLERENAFAQTDVELLATISINVGIAIQNAQLYMTAQQELEERKRAEAALQKSTSRLELLHNIDRALLAAQSPEEIATEALSSIRQLIPSQRVSVTLFDFEANEAKIVAANFDEDYFPAGRSFATLEEYGQYILDELLQNKPLRVDDVLKDSRSIELDKTLAQKGFQSWLYLPLFSQGRLIGALNLARAGEHPFTDEEEAIGYEVANQLAIVLQQNQLLDALQTELSERKRMQETLFEEKERAEVTLYSIGDAVITTDEKANAAYLNPVAESLIGWNMAEAVGQPLEKIFQVIEEGSRKPIPNPVERCLREGRIVALPNHSILISRDGTEYAIDDSAAPIRNRQGETIGAVLVFHDVTEERRLLQQIAHDAMHDSLTGLVNRREFEKRLEYALASVQEHGLSHILCYLDMDQFKIINDTAGHAAGDELLRQIVRLLRGTFRQRDTFARLGGDEFGLLLENCQLDQALVICNEIRTKVREFAFSWVGQNFQVGVSVGVVPINANTESVTQLLSQADIACYSAKDLGRDRIHVYETGDIESTRRYNEILQASRLRDAITNNQFRLYCQPISHLIGEAAGFKHYEVLVRMLDTEEHLVMPGAFIPPAERYGVMPAIDRWVIRATLMAMSRHDIQGMQFAINLSGTSLDDETLLEYVLEQTREFSIPLEQICFEITETAAIHHIHKAQEFIQAFRGQGGKVALDDFGSGFSSFRYLKSLPVDYLKIDGSFVHDMLSNRSDQVMVEAITLIAHTLGIGVIAEHVSDWEIIQVLREIGVEYAQGFGIGAPVQMEEIWGKDQVQKAKVSE